MQRSWGQVITVASASLHVGVCLEHHLQIHARAHSGSEAPPNSPTFPTTTTRETPMSSPEDQNVLRSESPTAPRAQRFDVSSLPRGQRPPPYTSTQAPAEIVPLRQLLLDATTHLVWLAVSAARKLSVQPDMSLMSFMRQANLALIAPVSDVGVDFRQRLAVDFPTSLASAADMSLSDIARVLLPSLYILITYFFYVNNTMTPGYRNTLHRMACSMMGREPGNSSS